MVLLHSCRLAGREENGGIWITYKVLDDNQLRTGSAEEILTQILRENKIIEDTKGMTAEEYADALLNEAGYFLPKVAIDSLNELKYDTKFDKSLKFLCTMPTSGAVIIAGENNHN